MEQNTKLFILGGLGLFGVTYLIMKNKILLLFLFVAQSLFSQVEELNYHVDSMYESNDDYLILTRIIKLDDSISNAEIITRIKNWSGLNFVNPNEVLVNETNQQLV